MAASGYTPISLYYSTTASAVPTAGNLANGELALNIADMKLYAKNSAGTVTLLASNASTTGVDSLSFGSTGLTPSTATTGAITVAGTLNVANGGTGQTSFTAGTVLYGNGTSGISASSNLFFDGANSRLGVGTNTPSVRLDVTDSRAGFYVSRFINTSATGYGIKIKNGLDTNDALRISNAADSQDTILMYGNGNAYFAGNVGIGTSTPSYKLHVAGTSGTVGLGFSGSIASGDNGIYFATNAVTGSYNFISGYVSATATAGVTFANQNNASSVAHSRLDIQTGGASGGDPKTTYTISGVLNWSTGVDNSDSDKFKISGSDSPGTSDYLTIDTSGNVGIGTTSPTARLEVKGAGGTTGKTFRTTDVSGNETFALIDGGNAYLVYGGFSVGTTANAGTGGIYATGNITAYYSSDIKFKENVRDIPDALATVNAIGGKLFDWTDEYIESKGGADGYFVQKADFGVVAQDVQKVFPIAVRTRPDGSLAVDYEKLGALAFAALTELTKRVEALEAK